MSYADENYYGWEQGYGNNDRPSSETNFFSPKYAETRTSGSDTDNQAKALKQAQNQSAFDSQARDAAVNRQGKIDAQALSTSGQRDDQLAKSESVSRRLIQSIDQDKVSVDNKFKSGESALDRNKSSDEFTQSRYQLKHNQAQDRANLEYSTAQGLAKDKQGQDAELARLRASGSIASALADKTNAANTTLANISQATELAGQSSAVDRARLAANAQIKAALFTPRQYQGY